MAPDKLEVEWYITRQKPEEPPTEFRTIILDDAQSVPLEQPFIRLEASGGTEIRG